MAAATSLAPSTDLISRLCEMGDWWDYQAGEHDSNPTEPKSEDWGRLNCELVAVDYAAPAL
jgi:hypothetical protein